MPQSAYPKHSPRIAALHLACGALIGMLPLANASPTGGVVVGGSGTIAQSGTNTVINQATQNLAINWDTFNVAANERVQFIQPNSTSIALNRILSNNGSIIAGRIDANGRVILINANGILFTSTAVLNVGSFVASSLDINPNDFMNGQYLFTEIPGANGAIVNQGMINASLGGNVALLGKQVRNEGIITANLGSVTLAAGKEAVLTFEDGGLLGVRVTKEVLQDELGVDPAVLNSGEIQAQGGRVLLTASQSQDIFSRAVNTTGLEPATSVVVNDDGSFTLGAGADVLNTGSIDVSGTAAGQNGGQIVLLGDKVTSSGTLRANALSGNGGEIELHATNTTLLTQNSLTSARSETNGQGGIVKVLGDQVGLFDQSTVNVSGANGGGQALIGGDFQGKNDNIRNASKTIITPGSTIYADAVNQGNGGKVIVWADDSTRFYGNIFARGGALSGNGGFAEVSGKETLVYEGYANLTAAAGSMGTLLLDPKNINICGTATCTTAGESLPNDFDQFSDNSSGTSFLSNGTLADALTSATVVLQASNDITIAANVTSAQTTSQAEPLDNDLVLQAGRSITINSGVSIVLDGGDFSATINYSHPSSTSSGLNPIPSQRDEGQAAFLMNGSSSIMTRGGNIEIVTGGFIDSSNSAKNSLSENIGNITLQTLNTSGVTPSAAGNDGSDAGDITVTNSRGNIIVNGQIEARGGTGSAGADGASGTGGAGGTGGNIDLSANLGNININVGAGILASGGTGGAGGAGAPESPGGTGGAGGNAGSIDLFAGVNLTVNASITAVGGIGGMGGAGGDNNLGFGNPSGGIGGNGGDAQSVLLTVGGDLTVNANILATAGVGGVGGSDVGGVIASSGVVGNNDTITFTGDGSDNIFTFNDVVLNGSTITLNADAGNDRLVRTGTGNNVWSISDENDGRLRIGSNTSDIVFFDVETLVGNAGQDQFSITTGTGSLSGMLNGGGGATDSLSLVAAVPATTIQLGLIDNDAVAVADGFLNVTGIETITAAGTGHTIRGENIATTWTINGTNSGNIAPTDGATPTNTVAFSGTGIATLTGGNDVDTFNMTAGSIGTLNGGDGVVADSFNVTGGVATTMNGGEGNDSFVVTAAAGAVTTLNGGDDNDSFNVTASGGANVTIDGGNDNDTIVVTGTMNGDVDGGAGTNTLTYNGTAGNDSIGLGASTLALSNSSGSFSFTYTGFNDITLNAQDGTDSVELNSVVLPGTLRLTSETVTGTGTAVDADTLILDNVTQFGANAIVTTVLNNLQLVNAASEVHLIDLNGLDIDLTMSPAGINGNSVLQIGGTTTIDAGGSALVLNNAGNNFDTVDISNAASIVLRDSDNIAAATMTAASINVTAENGIGLLTTNTADLTVLNTSGAVNIVNTGDVSASVITAGNISFTNTGDVMIRQMNTYGGGIPPYQSSSFGGHISMVVTDGGIYGTNYISGAQVPIPDIVAQTFVGTISSSTPGDDFGVNGMPVNVMVRERFDLSAIGHSAFIQFIPSRPSGTINATLTLSNDAVGGINTQLLEIDSLDEFDPAIFTEIRNYYYEDVAIMLPADQRLDAGGEDEEEGNTNKPVGTENKAACDPQPSAASDRPVEATCDKSEEKQSRS